MPVERHGLTGTPMSGSGPQHFITVDAETDVIRDGIATISAIRDRVEARERIRIPIVWFVRFQRKTSEYKKIDSPEYFAGPVTSAFDGFELARPELVQMLASGDEIGWHYHAYNYVHRTDLSHARRIAIVSADLVACAEAIRARHPYVEARSFRFGWFFIPDYGLFTTLERVGIGVDASIRPGTEGRQVKAFEATYLPALTTTPKKIGNIFFVPYFLTRLIHDYEVVAHDFGWSRMDAASTRRRQEEFEHDLVQTANAVKRGSGSFTTYRTFVASQSSPVA